MKEAQEYATAAAFRMALEERLRGIARKEGVDLSRLRRQVAFDRLLARLFRLDPCPWAVKGGYAMELRIRTARTTKDIHLTLRSGILHLPKDTKRDETILETLQDAASVSLGDHFLYRVGEPVRDLDAAPYGGSRYPVEARMAGRIFARFHVDVGVGDVPIEPLEVIKGRDGLEFVGIPTPSLYMISREQQFAEKLHAYTLPRAGTVNSRVRDLVDMILLIQSGTLKWEKVVEAIRLTFDRRKSHSIPTEILPPPPDWEPPFVALARECGLSDGVGVAFGTLESFLKGLP